MEHHIRLTGRNMVALILRDGREIRFCIPHSETACCSVSYHHKISARPLWLVSNASAQKCVWVNGRCSRSFGSASSSNIALKTHTITNLTGPGALSFILLFCSQKIITYSEINEHLYLGAFTLLVTETDMSQPPGWNHMAAELSESTGYKLSTAEGRHADYLTSLNSLQGFSKW